jgi:plasmid stability protein
MNMPNFSIRGIEPRVNDALKAKAARSGKSVNALILELINAGVGMGPERRTRHHDLDYLAGTWNKQDSDEFLEATRHFEMIDEMLWK